MPTKYAMPSSKKCALIKNIVQILDCAVAALKTLDLSDFVDVSDIFPQPYAAMSTSIIAPFDLPSVLVPPEVIELEVMSTESSEDAPIKKEEWPEYMLRLFDNDVTVPRLFSSWTDSHVLMT
jgi:nuclear cap-binding protein subunit 1